LRRHHSPRGSLLNNFVRFDHKDQADTVDRSFLLATKAMSAELSYIGITRYREDVQLCAGRISPATSGG
jgi:hypothetical protein